MDSSQVSRPITESRELSRLSNPRNSPDDQGDRSNETNTMINYFIATSSNGIYTRSHWQGGQLRNRNLGEIFDEVAKFASHDIPNSIVFQLISTNKCGVSECLKYDIRRGDNKLYKKAVAAFKRTINQGDGQDINYFEIILDLGKVDVEARADVTKKNTDFDILF